MKKLVLSMLVLFATITVFAKETNVKKVNEAYFIENVFDYTKSSIEFKGDKPVVLDMYADWCPPCKKLAPILDATSLKYKGKVDFIKVNTDHNKNLPSYFKVQGIPTLIFVTKSGKYFKSVGLISEKELKDKIAKYFKVK